MLESCAKWAHSPLRGGKAPWQRHWVEEWEISGNIQPPPAQETGLDSSYCCYWFQASLPHVYSRVTFWKCNLRQLVWLAWRCQKVMASSVSMLGREGQGAWQGAASFGAVQLQSEFHLVLPSLAAILRAASRMPVEWNQDLAHFSCLCRTVFSHSI